MGIVDGIIKFSIKKNLVKWTKGAATAAIAAGSPYLAQHFGIELTEEQKLALIAAVGSAIVGGANALKTQFPQQFGWL